jgi:hypothetical protein
MKENDFECLASTGVNQTRQSLHSVDGHEDDLSAVISTTSMSSSDILTFGVAI